MAAEKIKRIALIGPESTGKTGLCKLLAEHYKTLWVPEYARQYMEQLNQPYTLEDILLTAKEQLKLEEEFILKANKILFTDTEFIVAKVWCEDVFETCPAWIEKMIEEKKYDLYLLNKPDILWEDDPVRENPHRRNYFFELYKKELTDRKFRYEIISGLGEDRLQNALEVVENFVKKK